MGFFESLLVKLIGKRVDSDMTKWGISKAKVAFVLMDFGGPKGD